MQGRRRISYVHLMFDRHEVIFAEGAPTESFYPGAYTLRNLAEPDRNEVRRVMLRSAGDANTAGYNQTRAFLRPGRLAKRDVAPALLWTGEGLRQAGLAGHADIRGADPPGGRGRWPKPVAAAGRMEG